jgi:hypothetical protein
MRGAILPLSRNVFMVWRLVKHRYNFIFTRKFGFFDWSLSLRLSNQNVVWLFPMCLTSLDLISLTILNGTGFKWLRIGSSGGPV